MALQLTDAERQTLRGLQRQHRDGPRYVKVTVLLLLDKGRSVPYIADDLGLDPATVYRYAAAYQTQGLASYLAPETQTGGDLTSAQLGRLCRELDAHLYPDCRSIRDWVTATCSVTYSISGLTDLRHRLGYTCNRTTAVPCEAKAAF